MATPILSQSGIYVIRNTVNNKVYVGSAVNLYNRFKSHKSKLRRNLHPNTILQNSWNKHGENLFVFEVSVICDKENLLMYEQLVIDSLDFEKDCYNIRKIAHSNFGLKASEETKAKLSIISRARRHTKETKIQMSANMAGNTRALGFKHTLESRLKFSAAKKGIKKSEAHIEKMRINATGKKKSPETIAKLSKSLTGCVFSDDRKRKISNAHKGRKKSDEFKEKMRLIAKSRVGAKRSESTKEKMRLAWIVRKNKQISCVT